MFALTVSRSPSCIALENHRTRKCVSCWSGDLARLMLSHPMFPCLPQSGYRLIDRTTAISLICCAACCRKQLMDMARWQRA